MGAFFISIIRQHPKKHKRQSRPPMDRVTQRHWLHIGSGTDRRRKGELALNPRLPHNQRTYPSDCKAGARKSRPPWGKVAPTGDGRGELALKPRLPHNQRTYHNHANKPHQTRKAIQPRKRAPSHRALTGPPPTQRGRLKYSRKASANIQSNHYS